MREPDPDRRATRPCACSSSAASSSSSRTIALACSATSLAASPRPEAHCRVSRGGGHGPSSRSPSRATMPVGERGADDDPRDGPPPTLLLRPRAELRPGRRDDGRSPGVWFGRRLALHARLDQARLELADEARRPRRAARRASPSSRPRRPSFGELLQLRRPRSIDLLIGVVISSLTGGSSPVAYARCPGGASAAIVARRAERAVERGPQQLPEHEVVFYQLWPGETCGRMLAACSWPRRSGSV